jgi:hypothetical protein
LVFRRQLRPLCQRGIKNGSVRPGNNHPGGIACLVADDLAARGFGVSFV